MLSEKSLKHLEYIWAHWEETKAKNIATAIEIALSAGVSSAEGQRVNTGGARKESPEQGSE